MVATATLLSQYAEEEDREGVVETASYTYGDSAWASDSAKNIDFDNAEEGKGGGYYFKKAWERFWRIFS